MFTALRLFTSDRQLVIPFKILANLDEFLFQELINPHITKLKKFTLDQVISPKFNSLSVRISHLIKLILVALFRSFYK